MKSIFQLKRFYMFLCVIGFLVFAYKLLELRYTDKKYIADAGQNVFNYKMQAHHYETDGQQIRYLEIGCDTLPMLFLIHGSPSSSMSWQALLKDSLMLSKFHMIAVDRPGYGYSGFGKVQTSIVKQAEALMPILKEKRQLFKKIMIVGSSYGGPVAVRLAQMYPELMDVVMLQSSSMQPSAEKIYPITYPTSKIPLRWLIPAVFRMANDEKLSHKDALLEIDEDWEKIVDPVTIFHGKNDGLIYFSNAEYAQSKLVNSDTVNLVAVPDGEHGMLWSKPELVKQTMIETLELIK